jgi:hypothetical protein
MEFVAAIDSAFDRWCNAPIAERYKYRTQSLLTPYNTIYFKVFSGMHWADKMYPNYLLTIWFFISKQRKSIITRLTA